MSWWSWTLECVNKKGFLRSGQDRKRVFLWGFWPGQRGINWNEGRIWCWPGRRRKRRGFGTPGLYGSPSTEWSPSIICCPFDNSGRVEVYFQGDSLMCASFSVGAKMYVLDNLFLLLEIYVDVLLSVESTWIMKSSSSRSNGEMAQSWFQNSEKSWWNAGFGLGVIPQWPEVLRVVFWAKSVEFFALTKVRRQAKHLRCLLFVVRT